MLQIPFKRKYIKGMEGIDETIILTGYLHMIFKQYTNVTLS